MSTIYIAGGGPSLKDFDWNLLDGKTVIAVNRAYEVLPNAQYIYFSDLRFWQWHRRALVNHSGEKITGNYRVTDNAVKKYNFTGSQGLEKKAPGLKTGNNSGYAAINLAYHLGAKVIILLGFDMCRSTHGEYHWHGGYPVKNRDASFSKMLRYFETIAQPLQDEGIEVLNACPTSNIKCFAKVAIEDVFQ